MEAKSLNFEQMEAIEGGWQAGAICGGIFGAYGALAGYGVSLAFGGPIGLGFAIVYSVGTSVACSLLTE